MTFVNEFVSEEDIQRYKLDEQLRDIRGFSWRDGRPSTFVHTWTVDRARDSYLVLGGTIYELGPSGRDEPTTLELFVLSQGNLAVHALLDSSLKSLPPFESRPFCIVWELLGLKPEPLDALQRQTMLALLKEALTAYGYRGAHRQVEGTVVEFMF